MAVPVPSAHRWERGPKAKVRPAAVAALRTVRPAGARPGDPAVGPRTLASQFRIVPGQRPALLGPASSAGADTHLRRLPFLGRTTRQSRATTGQGSSARRSRWRVPDSVLPTAGHRVGTGGPQWFRAWIPGAFHLVLAAYVVTLGAYHLGFSVPASVSSGRAATRCGDATRPTVAPREGEIGEMADWRAGCHG